MRKDHHIHQIRVENDNVIVSFSVYEVTTKTIERRNAVTLEPETGEVDERSLIFSDTLTFDKAKAIEIASAFASPEEIQAIQNIGSLENSGDAFHPILERYIKTLYETPI